jgi:hypothetical protein
MHGMAIIKGEVWKVEEEGGVAMLWLDDIVPPAYASDPLAAFNWMLRRQVERGVAEGRIDPDIRQLLA